MRHVRQTLLSLAALIALFVVGCATNQAPDAAFSVDPGTGTIAKTFAFDASNSDGSALSYAWDFGDTETTTGKKVDHQFATPGSYNVELTVTDATGMTDTTNRDVNVAHTVTSLGNALTTFGDDMVELANDAMSDPALLALLTLPDPNFFLFGAPPFLLEPAGITAQTAAALSLPHMAGRINPSQIPTYTLMRGVYEWNAELFEWQLIDDTSDDLILRWTVDSDATTAAAELTLDWNAGADTETKVSRYGDQVEVPVDMLADLTIDGEAAGSLQLTFDWYDGPPCSGAIFEPTAVTVSGEIGLTSSLTVEASFAITDNATGLDEVTTSGAIDYASAGDTTTLTWDVTIGGLLEREVAGADFGACFLLDFDIDEVAVALGLDTDLATAIGAMQLDMTVSDFDLMLGTGAVAGSFTVDDIDTLTFAGTLADSDMDGVPDIALTDADGEEQSLAEFLASLTPEVEPVPGFGSMWLQGPLAP